MSIPTLAVSDLYEFEGMVGQTTYMDNADTSLRVGTIIRIDAITITGQVRYTLGYRTTGHGGDQIRFTGDRHNLDLLTVLALIDNGYWVPANG